ncbi:MAG: DUF3180 domain-containing protein [Acidothermus cellulolyticus]|nr:DUF3180 domain-containing protein [Acidothermus cellulolyticus]
MKPTRVPILVALAIVVAAATWALVGRIYDSLPTLSLYAPIALGVLALAEVAFAISVRRRIRHPTPGYRIDPIFVSRLVVLAKASAYTGAILTGVYAGFLGYTLTAPGRGQLSADARTSAIAAGLNAALVVAALFLENGCRVPRPPDEADGRPPKPA